MVGWRGRHVLHRQLEDALFRHVPQLALDVRDRRRELHGDRLAFRLGLIRKQEPAEGRASQEREQDQRCCRQEITTTDRCRRTPGSRLRGRLWNRGNHARLWHLGRLGNAVLVLNHGQDTIPELRARLPLVKRDRERRGNELEIPQFVLALLARVEMLAKNRVLFVRQGPECGSSEEILIFLMWSVINVVRHSIHLDSDSV